MLALLTFQLYQLLGQFLIFLQFCFKCSELTHLIHNAWRLSSCFYWFLHPQWPMISSLPQFSLCSPREISCSWVSMLMMCWPPGPEMHSCGHLEPSAQIKHMVSTGTLGQLFSFCLTPSIFAKDGTLLSVKYKKSLFFQSFPFWLIDCSALLQTVVLQAQELSNGPHLILSQRSNGIGK